MSDTNMNDDQLITEGEVLPELETGDDEAQLQSGDDLAAQALSDANATSLPTANKKNTEPQVLADTLISLQNVIERNVNQLDELKDQLRLYREQLKSVFENDSELAQAEEQASQASRQMKEKKARIQASSEAMQLKANITEVNEHKKEIEEALNNHLLNLYSVTGTKTFDTSDGRQREFTIRAAIKGKGKQEE